jgi:hypothetical protein
LCPRILTERDKSGVEEPSRKKETICVDHKAAVSHEQKTT